MSIPTILGVLLGFGLFAGAIASATDNYLLFFSGTSFTIVMGGTLAAAFIGYQARYVVLSLRDIGRVFVKQKIDRRMLTVETGKIIRWGYLVKKTASWRWSARSSRPRTRITSSTTASSW